MNAFPRRPCQGMRRAAVTAPDLTQSSHTASSNRGLFSQHDVDHVLKVRVPSDTFYAESAVEAAADRIGRPGPGSS
jgi:hypothetical protein